MKLLFSLVLLCFTAPLATEEIHPVHISVADLTYKEEEQVLQLAKRIFTDDLEDQLQKLDLVDFRIDEKGRAEAVDKALDTFLLNQLVISVDGKPLRGKLLGHEFEGLATWFYIEYQTEGIKESLEITDSSMMEVFDDQENLYHVNLNGNTKDLQTFKLTSKTMTASAVL